MVSTPEIEIESPNSAPTPDRWWRSLFEASEDAQMVCRTDGAVVEANRRAWQLLGLPHGAKLPAPLLSSFLTPATAKRLTDLVARPGGRQETVPAVSLLCRGQLSLIADLQVTPLEAGCSLVTIKDASRRWRMESHVQRLITAVNSTTDVVFLTDAEYRLTFVNAAFQQVTGHTIEDALGREAEFLRAPTETEKVQAYLQAVSRGEDWRGELVNARKDGSRYPVEAAISPIYDRNGAMLGYVCFERDISAQKRLQHELQLERDYTQSIINSVDAAVYTVDRDLRLCHVNRRWETLPPEHGGLFFSEPPQLGRSLLDYVGAPANRLRVKAVLERVLRDGQPQEVRDVPDAGQKWLVKVTPWKHQAEVLGLNYVVVDQTQFCELQTQLFQAQKMETIGALAAGVAHDFNNLLLAIRGNVSLLQMEEALSANVLSRLAHIDQAAARAAEITQQLLSFSRSSEEKEVVLDFNQVAQEASRLARRTLKNRVELHLELPASPITVRIDSTRASQVLLNLTVNAADAMPQGGCLTIRNQVVSLSADLARKHNRLPEADFLCCSVADTGTGIPPEVLARIFDPFFTTKPKGKGTGLGLAIVQNVISRGGGFIEVESALGKGTTFHLYLPIAAEGITERTAAPEPGVVSGTGRVLIVDDMDFICDFTRSFLAAAGYEVLTAASADEADAILAREAGRLDVVLTDHNMPGRSGLDLIKDIKTRWPGVHCVLASGYLEEEEVRRIENELGVPILNKPYNIREATALVERILARRPREAAQGAASKEH